MVYLLMSTQIRLEVGPTYVGDDNSDMELMTYLNAVKSREPGNNFGSYKTRLCAREVLDLLEEIGYKVVASCGIGQTCIWTLHKPDEPSVVHVNDKEDQDRMFVPT